MTIIQEVVNELYLGESPFLFVDRSMKDMGYPHTNIIPARIDKVLQEVSPTFWLELGSMTGGSAIRVAERIKALKMKTQMVCVDPFTGDVNMWDWEKKLTHNKEWRFLALKNGRPTIYDRFLANISESGHADVIVPLQCTAMVGLKLLKRLKDQGRLSELPQVIYLDSAHELEETFVELKAAWDILPERGLLWGDDWSWEAVREDVSKFCAFIGTKPIIDEGHWMVWK
jgi:hypothetical protein